jgi:geranylgeranyl pyrophosphate synthase
VKLNKSCKVLYAKAMALETLKAGDMSLTLEEYWRIIRQKTAVLFALVLIAWRAVR